jgi:predicted DNA-binding transcriptional regulator YafY
VQNTNKNWPVRWDLLFRYRLIEIVTLWEGRLTTNHLCQAFGIGRQQASGDINSYLRDIAPGNLVYDKHLKGYVPSATFAPQVTNGLADEYLHALARNNELSQTFETLNLQVPNTEVLSLPLRAVKPEIVRPLVLAARTGKRLEVEYASFSNPKPDVRVIAPHTLVFSGLRWHVRAWCEKNGAYRDFVLSRFRGVPDIIDDLSTHGAAQDTDWNTEVTIRLKPDSRFTPEQRKIIAQDYGMTRQVLRVETRGALVQYMLDLLRIDTKKLESTPEAQQVVIENLKDIERWLF